MTVRELEPAPSLPRLYGRAALTARTRKGDSLPDLAYEIKDASIDRDRLGRYALVCGFRQSDTLPPTYPHILGFPAAVSLMVDPAFPFPLPGLVHVGNRIEQWRPIKADERPTLRIHAERLRDHPRGRQFDMITEATVDGDRVWTETSTYLRRDPSKKSPPRSDTSPSGPAADGDGQGLKQTAIWRIPSDMGRRYAAVSGDVNPIHLNPLVARLFGFKRAIAHGMWLKARCLAAFEGKLPDGHIAEVEFKSPLLLPSTVAFSSAPDGPAWLFAVSHASSGRPHLNGRVRAFSEAGAL